MMGHPNLRRDTRMDFEIPEPFQSAIARGEPAAVSDAHAESGLELFARATARMLVGRDDDAREDYEAAADDLGDACEIQLGFLDLRGGRNPAEVVESARSIVGRNQDDSVLKGRALHLLGLAEIKRRGTSESLDALLRAADIYRQLNRRDLLAQVQDTLGMQAAAEGRLDHALSWYAMSIVGKNLSGDRYGTAVTLGNLGRLHLRAGRFEEADDCFGLDLEMARSMSDRRAEARLLNDLGRLRLDQGEFDSARKNFDASLKISEADGFRDLVFFNNKDLARLLVAIGRLGDAKVALERAEELAEEAVPAYRHSLIDSIRGLLALQNGDLTGLDMLEKAATAFSELRLPDDEIRERLRIADALCGQGQPRAAEQHLSRALDLARRDGYARHLPAIREAMGRLTLVESAVEESGRTLRAGRSKTPSPEGYVLFESLGAGGFGEVFRAFDSEKAQIVALKRLRLEELYDVHLRERLQATAKLELEAASRIRHPGVARVHAVGTDSEGGTYIVQEFVDGVSLRETMRSDPDRPLVEKLELFLHIAHALNALHDRNVVHRDLKPENILLRTADGSPVLVDFGIARLPDVDDVVGRESIVGTLGYMAPEQLRARPVDGKADVYSFGVIAFEWLTGTRPNPPSQQGLSDAITEVLERRKALIEKNVVDLPEDLAQVVLRMLASRSHDRPSAAHLAECFARLARRKWGAQKTVIRDVRGSSATDDGKEDAIETEWLES